MTQTSTSALTQNVTQVRGFSTVNRVRITTASRRRGRQTVQGGTHWSAQLCRQQNSHTDKMTENFGTWLIQIAWNRVLDFVQPHRQHAMTAANGRCIPQTSCSRNQVLDQTVIVPRSLDYFGEGTEVRLQQEGVGKAGLRAAQIPIKALSGPASLISVIRWTSLTSVITTEARQCKQAEHVKQTSQAKCPRSSFL